jgi:crossover junction endodeoxyribonuclease RusA
MVKITVDYPPSANRYWRHNRGRIHRSTEADAYRQQVALLCATAGITPLEGEVSVTMHFYRPAKRGDLDNRFKQILDALQSHAYHNDSQIAEIHATRRDDKHCPRVEIEVTTL